MTARGSRTLARRIRADMDLPRRVFRGLRCDHCRAGLHDEHGNPRWDVIGKDPLLFICPDGCKETTK